MQVGDDPIRDFYDDLAPDYHLLFADWDAAIARQGAALDGLINKTRGSGGHDVLDCACGIGTQAIALAARGHRVVGTDLSGAALRRAANEAGLRTVVLRSAVADMRHLPFRGASFDIVVCADNAIAHLLTPDELRQALAEMRRVLRPTGLLVLGVRSDLARQSHPVTSPVQLNRSPAGPVITFQLWDWHPDGQRYDMQHIQLHPSGDSYAVRVRRATSWAHTQAELADHLSDAGWRSIEWHAPEETGFFQPLVTASAHPADIA